MKLLGFFLALVLLAEIHAAAAATCSPTELIPCLPAITSSAAPSSQCCAKLREQRPCLCGYIRNPSYRQYVSSPNAQRVARQCGVATPKC